MTVINFRVTSRSFIPGASGYDTAGGPKQGKVRVVGEFDITSYTSGGEVILPAKFGLSVIDSIDFEAVENLPTATVFTMHRYDRTNSKVFAYAVDTAGASGDELSSATTGGDLGRISYVAYGDPALPTEVLITDSINP